MSLFTIAESCEGNLQSWAGLHKTLEAAKALVESGRTAENDGVVPNELVWELIGDNDCGAWWQADDEGCTYEIAEHKIDPVA